jgi:hypothetical protein
MIGIANTSYKLSRVGGHHFIAVLPDCALRLECQWRIGKT